MHIVSLTSNHFFIQTFFIIGNAVMGLETFFQDMYPKIDGFGRNASYKLNRKIRDNEASRWRYLYGAGISFSAGLSMATIFTTGLCGALDCLIQSAKKGELVYGNMQTSIVYGSELWRSTQALFMGSYMALSHSPKEAAEKYLTIAADPHKARLNRDEAARVYAMGDLLREFFIKHKINHRMCSGTALGAFRDLGIILNDDDEDYLIHPDDVERLEKLFEDGTFTAETGIQVRRKEITGGWQCFYADSPKKFFSDEAIKVNNPDAEPDIGDPFIDIFPAVRKTLGNKEIFTYGKLEMSAQSPGDYLTPEEWGTEPTIYPFGPTTVWGIEREAMLEYLKRCYGPTALDYKTLLLPHKAYANASVELRKSYQSARAWSFREAYSELRKAYSTVTENPLPRFMRNETPVSTDFDKEVYYKQKALADMFKVEVPNPADPAKTIRIPDPNQRRIWVDGIFDIFHFGHTNILRNALKRSIEKYPGKEIVLYIGACGDGQDVKNYKRQPYMNLGERCYAVDLAMKELLKEMKENYPDVKISYQIVPNSPVDLDPGLPEKYNLNTMFHGNDFKEADIEKCYGQIMKICDFETLPYTKGVSTTALLKELKENGTLGTCPNTTGIPVEELAARVQGREAALEKASQAEAVVQKEESSSMKP